MNAFGGRAEDVRENSFTIRQTQRKTGGKRWSVPADTAFEAAAVFAAISPLLSLLPGDFWLGFSGIACIATVAVLVASDRDWLGWTRSADNRGCHTTRLTPVQTVTLLALFVVNMLALVVVPAL